MPKAAYGVQDHGKTSATASLGMITLWDVEGGLPQIDKYLYSRDNHVVAGMLTHPEHGTLGVDHDYWGRCLVACMNCHKLRNVDTILHLTCPACTDFQRQTVPT